MIVASLPCERHYRSRPLSFLLGAKKGCYVTNRAAEGRVAAQVIENYGGADGTRTRDLLRDRQAF